MTTTPEEDTEYNQFVERYSKLSQTNVQQYANIILEDDETSSKTATKATEAEIKNEIELLLGNTKEWAHSEETAIFQNNMAKYVFRKSYLKFARKRLGNKTKESAVLPPVYLSVDPIPEKIQKEGFYCYITMLEKQMVTTLKCDCQVTAETIAEKFIQKADRNFKNIKKEDWIFKAKGTRGITLRRSNLAC